MEQNALSKPRDWTALWISIVLFVLNGALLLFILSAALSELARYGALAGQSIIVRVLPSLAMASALVGGALAYATMGLVRPSRIRFYQTASALFFIVALALLLTKVFGPLFGLT